MGSTISVASVVYNLAGDEEDRINYLKTLVIGNVVSESNFSMADTLSAGYLQGPGLKLRNFVRWAESSGYNDIMGFSYAEVHFGDSIDQNVLATQLPVGPGEHAIVQSAEIGRNDITFFAEVYIYENYPDLWDTAWVADLLDNGDIKIIFGDASEVIYTPTPAYDPLGRYMHVRYVTARENVAGPIVYGDPVPLGSGEAFPDVTDWTEVVSDDPVPTDLDTVTIVDTVITYSDGRPGSDTHEEIPGTSTYDKIDGEFTTTIYNGESGGSITSTNYWQYHTQSAVVVDLDPVVEENTVEIEPGVFETTEVTTIGQTLEISREYREDTQEIILNEKSDLIAWNYEFESGNAILDPMFSHPVTNGSFFPYIPFRLGNQPVNETLLPILYPWAKKAFRKSVRGRFDKTLADIEENENVGDIDFAYTAFGVSLNVVEPACKKYIYKFFQYMLNNQFDSSYYETWKTLTAEYAAAAELHNQWEDVQEFGPDTDPLYGTPEPVVPEAPSMPQYFIQVASGGSPLTNFNMVVFWAAMAENVGVGQKIPGAKKGDLWWDGLSNEVFPNLIYNGRYTDLDGGRNVQKVVLNWQETDNSWRSLAFWNLGFKNYVYNGKDVQITALEALLDTDESGFIIPLHTGLYKSLSLVDSTQMATACCFMVFNCYTIVKQKWYQTTVFKIILVIVIAVVAVFTAGAGAGAAGGLLGSNVAVGTALGFTGLVAVIVGAVANAIAAMILMQIITDASVSLFGDKIGAIIGAIAGMIAIGVGTSVANGGSVMDGFSNLLKADNILKLTEAAGKGYTEYIQAGTAEIMAETAALDQSNDAIERQLAAAYGDNIGYSRGMFDPMGLTDAATQLGFAPESLDSFLSRTLMTGSEVVELSQQLIYNFTRLTLDLDTLT